MDAAHARRQVIAGQPWVERLEGVRGHTVVQLHQVACHACAPGVWGGGGMINCCWACMCVHY